MTEKNIWVLQGEQFAEVKSKMEALKENMAALRKEMHEKQNKLADEYWESVYPILGIELKEGEPRPALNIDIDHEARGVLIINLEEKKENVKAAS